MRGEPEYTDGLCNCEADPYDEYDTDPTHYRRVCVCGAVLFCLHCEHDGVQSRCSYCGTRYPQRSQSEEDKTS